MLSAMPAMASGPCGGLALDNGAVGAGKPLKVGAVLDADDVACAQAIAAGLIAKPTLRSVTVAARVPDAMRLEGGGLKVAKSWADALVAAGLPVSLVAAVAALPGPGEAASLRIAFAEQKGARPVAVIASASGAVSAGVDPAHMQPVRPGAQLTAYDYVQTASGATAKVTLADGSAIALASGTLLRVGATEELNAQLKRVTKVDLLRGRVEVLAGPGSGGATLEVVTRSAVASVRGARVRVAAEGGGATTRVETLVGKVALRGEKGAVVVANAQGASVDNTRQPSAPIALIGPAVGLQPQNGKAKSKGSAQWREVAKAAQYLVEVAADPEFLLQRRTWHEAGPKWTIDPSLVGKQWFWRVTPVDGGGFEGLSSKVSGLTVE